MWHPAIDDVHGFDAALGGFECAADFRQHTATDGAIGKQGIDLSRAQVGQQLTRFVNNTSFSALSTVASLEATTSALML